MDDYICRYEYNNGDINMLGSIQAKTGFTPSAAPSKPAPTAGGEAATTPPTDQLASARSPELPSLKEIQQRAQAASAEAPAAAPAQPKEGLSMGKKAALMGLTGVAAFGALAGTAQAADFGIIITPGGGIGVTIGDGHGHHRHRGHGRHRRGHGNHGRHHGGHHGNYICGPANNTDGPYRTGLGLDGEWHRFDRHNEVNDSTGHYRFTTDFYGNVNGVSCNVQQDGYWGW
jgi:hypothetical protein